MIISHQHKFIFIKTAKTAGTSIEVFLSRWCGKEDIVTPIRPPIEGHQPRNHEQLVDPRTGLLWRPEGLHRALRNVFERRQKFYNHMPAWLVQQRIPARVWNSYFKFCVERNPWDKVLSHYHMVASRADGSLSLDQYLLSNGRVNQLLQSYTDPSGAEYSLLTRWSAVRTSCVLQRCSRTSRWPSTLAYSPSVFGPNQATGPTAHLINQCSMTDKCRIVEQAFAREIGLQRYRL